MSHSSCGCNIKHVEYIDSSCGLVPEYDPGCNDCGGKTTYDFEVCVFICRDGEHGDNADVYESLIDDNKDHPVDGARKSTPTWVLRSVCAAFRPEPVVIGAGVTSSKDPITGQITYTVVSGSGADGDTTYSIVNNADGSQSLVGSDGTTEVLNDETCQSSAETDALGTTVVSRTCYNSDGSILSGPTAYLTIQAGTVDTINGISMPDANGCVTVTRPDLSTEQFLDATIAKCQKANTFSAIKSLNSLFRQGVTPSDTTVALERSVLTLATEVVTGVAVSPAVPGPLLVATHVLNKADYCTGTCPYNGLRIQIHARSSKQDLEDGILSPNVITAYEIDGAFSESDTVISAPTQGADIVNNEVDIIEMPFDANDQITIKHIVNRFPALNTIADGFSLLTVKVRACVCINND